MLYTIIPIDKILDEPKVDYYQEMNVSGIACYVERLSDFKYKVVRIHSSDPKKYLEKGLQPGSIINLKDKL